MASVMKVTLPFISLFAGAYSQFVAAPSGFTETKGFLDLPVRYKEIPTGICETTPGVKSYTGYVDIAEDAHIFFWFFEARNEDPTTAPLSVWINGGPGSSSMIGLFQELGPCGVDINGDVYNNPYAFNNVSNMIFIDQPSTVGLSYSIPVPAYTSSAGSIVQLPDETCPEWAADLDCGTYSSPIITGVTNSTISSADNFWKTIQGFMGAFPQYSRNGFNFATESYGGHYGPVYNEYFEEQNALVKAGKLPGAHEISLDTVLIGNGWYDPLIQYAAYYNFTVFPGNTYDYKPFTKAMEAQMYNAMYGPGNCYDMTVDCYTTGRDDVCAAADTFCYNEVEYLLDTVNRDEYDIREKTPDRFPYEFYVDYLNSPKVQSAIGAFTNFSEFSSTVGAAFGTTGDDDKTEGSVEDVKKLIEQGVYVVMYNGDADYICNWIGNLAVADEVNPAGWSSAGWVNVSTSDGVTHGQVKQSANFAFTRVFEAGHEVPFYNPIIALTFFERAISGLDIEDGKTKVSLGCDYETVGTPTSTYREGNATVQFKVLPKDATYNITTGAPNPPKKGGKMRRDRKTKRQVRPRRRATGVMNAMSGPGL